MKYVPFFLIQLILLSCSEGKRPGNAYAQDTSVVELRYAEGFTITKVGDATQVTVRYPYQGATAGHTYLLVKDGADVPDVRAGPAVITGPLHSIGRTPTAHVPIRH